MAEAYIEAVSAFLYAEDAPSVCDAIFIPGSAWPEHVLKAAEMYRVGYAPVVVPSGRYAIGTEEFAGPKEFATEWAWMRSLLLEQGIPEKAILREDRATYTWENAQLSRKVCDAARLTIRKGMLCCRPHHARRALLYYQAAFPDTEWIVCPADVPGLNREDWYLTREGRDTILGEVRRLGSQVNEVFEQMLEDRT